MIFGTLGKNVFWLYIFTAVKVILPLVTLPYLTRVLSIESYGVVLFIQSCLMYAKITVNFGFALSAVKTIISVREDKKQSSIISGEIVTAQLILSAFCFVLALVMTEVLPILRQYRTYALLAFIPVFFEAFFLDPLFRATEKMHMIAVRFLISQLLIVFLIIFFVRGDAQLLLIPLFEIVGALTASILTISGARRLGYSLVLGSICKAWEHIKQSFIYFASNMSLTAFNALNTVIIGITMPPEQVAYWAVALQMMGGIQQLYSPITNGIYPRMVATKKRAILFKCCEIFLPVVLLGCIATYFISDWVVGFIAGDGYAESARVLRLLLPVIFFSFLSMLYGWPALGPIGKQKETTMTTVGASCFQCIGLGVLLIYGLLTLTSIAILRCITEILLFGGRYFIYRRNIKEFQ